MPRARSFRWIYALLTACFLLVLVFDIWVFSIDRNQLIIVYPVALIGFLVIVRDIERHEKTCPHHRYPK